MPFKKGHSGNPGGRPKGTSNIRAEELKAQLQKRGDKLLKWLDAQIEAQTLEPRDVIALLKLCTDTSKDSSQHAGPQTVINLGFLAAKTEPQTTTAKVMTQDTPVALIVGEVAG